MTPRYNGWPCSTYAEAKRKADTLAHEQYDRVVYVVRVTAPHAAQYQYFVVRGSDMHGGHEVLYRVEVRRRDPHSEPR